MIRLFVGLALPAEARDTLADLSIGIPGIRWVPEDNLHVTLRFIGDVDEPDGETAHEALARIHAAPFTIEIAGLGLFGSGHRAKTLWAGIAPNPALTQLRNKIESALVRAGFEPEGRKFTPHVSLARLNNPPAERLAAFVAGHNLLCASFSVERFVLFSSWRGNNHPVYREAADYPLT